MPFVIDPMRVEHIPAVMAVERLSFPAPWPSSAYRKEIQNNRMAHYFVAREVDHHGAPLPGLLREEVQPKSSGSRDGIFRRIARLLNPEQPRQSASERGLMLDLQSVVGYAGMWIVAGNEAHITTIAVHPVYRGRGVGELLLVRCIDQARSVGADRVTLEVRVSNEVAKQLYAKYEFSIEGRRRRYYSDNGEDADIMTTPMLGSKSFLCRLAENRAQLEDRLARHG